MTSRFMTARLLGYLGPAGAHTCWSITVNHGNVIGKYLLIIHIQ